MIDFNDNYLTLINLIKTDDDGFMWFGYSSDKVRAYHYLNGEVTHIEILPREGTWDSKANKFNFSQLLKFGYHPDAPGHVALYMRRPDKAVGRNREPLDFKKLKPFFEYGHDDQALARSRDFVLLKNDGYGHIATHTLLPDLTHQESFRLVDLMNQFPPEPGGFFIVNKVALTVDLITWASDIHMAAISSSQTVIAFIHLNKNTISFMDIK